MLPDSAPLSPAPESSEAQLLRFSLPEPPASLDARMRALLAADPARAATEAATEAALETALRRFTLPSPPAALDARIRELAAAAPAEEALGRFVLPATSAALDARVHALLAGRGYAVPEAPAVLASHPRRSFWRRAAPFAAGLAACAALALLLRPQAPQTVAPSVKGVAGTADVAVNTDSQPVETIAGVSSAANPSPVRAPVTEYAVPVGYEYQGSRTVYTRETPLGTVMPATGEPMRAVRRDKLERHLYCNPKTQETLEVDTPHEDLVLENLTSY